MKHYIVGIDLGTSNTAVACAEAGSDAIQLFAIEQLTGLGEVAAKPLLPSVRYHPAPGELRPADIRLPWQAADIGGLDAVVVGSLARELGAGVPGRLVASAKSWLSHAGVERLAPILPWGADDEVGKVSPVAASASYLAHVRAAWNRHFPQAPLDQQEVVLTVPASFDEGARALTLEAAKLAGLPRLRLLEEPQAAFYDWLFRHRRDLQAELAPSRLVLVCDVGGGTTDFTLIQVEAGNEAEAGEPRLTRIGIGDHLMLGGDNMDLALAHRLEPRLAGDEGRLSAARFSQLIQGCRMAKESLLGADAPAAFPVTLLGGGSRVVGGARSAELSRDEVRQLIVDGFFPLADPDGEIRRRRSGLVEFGLPYPADPAVTRHLAAFLRRHAAASRQALGSAAPGGQALPVPDTLLFNGGVFRAAALARRVEDLLSTWRGSPLRVLHNDNPDAAVARGAVAYALLRGGRGLFIGGGSPRSYFLVLEDGGQGRSGICVLPRGSAEGQEIPLEERSFALRLGQPVRFHLVSSAADAAPAAGEMVPIAGEEFAPLPPIATVIPAGPGSPREDVPVRLVSTMTEVGTLEIHCVHAGDPARRWRLEFQLRGPGAGAATPAAGLPARFSAAVEQIDRVYGSRSQQVQGREVKQLRSRLEHLLGRREEWDLPLLRALFDALWERARRRRRSAEHERLWLNLAGFCLRPGLGDALDSWRAEQLWSLFPLGLQYGGESQNWSEWWTLWRRSAGGLPADAQLRLLEDLGPYLQPEGQSRFRLPNPARGSDDDMLRLAASLERLPVERKIEVGDWLLSRLKKPAGNKAHLWWAVGRIGSREPLYGSAHNVVPAAAAAIWLEAVLAEDWKQVEAAAFAAAQIARLTGDRQRDLPQEARDRVIQRLTAAKASPGWIAMVSTMVRLDLADERRVFGEALPVGLKLIDR